MNWTWISGSDTANQYGNYGSLGVASSTNVPGARYDAVGWISSDDDTLYLFGGFGLDGFGSSG